MSYHSNGNWQGWVFKSVTRGQEFVIQDNEKVEKWVQNLISKNLEI
jgi:hypothetical protein